MFRKLFVASLVTGVVLLSGGMVLAGGWALTEFDEPLPEFTAGQEHVIGFTVLQHGQTPRWTESVHLTFKAPDGGPIVKFPAEPAGAEGHFEAVVVLPRAGVWEFEVDQGFLTDFPLHLEPFVVGPVQVGTAAGAAELAAPPPPTVPAVVTGSVATEPNSGLALGIVLAVTGAAFVAGALVTWMSSSPRTHRRQKVYKKAQPIREAAWTTKN